MTKMYHKMAQVTLVTLKGIIMFGDRFEKEPICIRTLGTVGIKQFLIIIRSIFRFFKFYNHNFKIIGLWPMYTWPSRRP